MLEGTKTWISNGGIAGFYLVLAKTDAAAGARGISAVIVDDEALSRRGIERLLRNVRTDVEKAEVLARRTRGIALQSVLAGMALSVAGMIAALAGVLPPVAGALLQEAIDVVVILNALRAVGGVRARPVSAVVSAADLAVLRRVESLVPGEHLTPQVGAGTELAMIRPYFPGDDVRYIDWNVTARAGAPFIKKYREDRELNIFLAVDVSASSWFGSVDQSKRDLGAEVAALLGPGAHEATVPFFDNSGPSPVFRRIP